MSTYLEERIEWYDHNYRMGTPLINDDQFDKLEANLFRVDPKANYFSKKSILPLPSLPKDRIEEFIEGLLPDTRLIIEPKIDGCAIALQYIDGELIKAISRKGGDLTNKIKKIPDNTNITVNWIGQLSTLYHAVRAPNKSTPPKNCPIFSKFIIIRLSN